MDNKANNKIASLTKEQIDKRFKNILKLATTDKSPNQVLDILRKQLNNILIPVQPIDKSSPSIRLYRVTIPFDNFDETNPTHFSHPPKSETKMGRVNIKNHPVLYCSADQKTAIKEMKGKITKSNTFYISEWELSYQPNILFSSLMYNSQTISQKGIRNFVAENLKQKYEKYSVNSVGYIQKKMGDLFSLPGNKNYNLTSAYAHDILYGLNSKIDKNTFLIYPSIESVEQGINFVFPPSMVLNKSIELIKVGKYIFNGTSENNNIHVSLVSKSINNNETLTWSNISYGNLLIHYNKLIIKTYNGQNIIGLEAKELEITNNSSKVKNICENEIKKYLDNNPNNISNKEIESLTDIKKTDHNETLNISFPHGLGIITDTGKDFIKSINIPITWENGFLD